MQSSTEMHFKVQKLKERKNEIQTNKKTMQENVTDNT